MTLKRESFDRSLDRFGDGAPCAAVTPGFPYQCAQARGSVLSHPSLGCSKSKTGFGRYYTKGSVLFQMGLEHPKSRHRQLSVFVRQLQEFVHAISLRQIALKYLRQIILKATPASTKVVQRITSPKDSISVEHSGVFSFGSKSSSCICSLAWKNLFAIPAERIIAC